MFFPDTVEKRMQVLSENNAEKAQGQNPETISNLGHSISREDLTFLIGNGFVLYSWPPNTVRFVSNHKTGLSGDSSKYCVYLQKSVGSFYQLAFSPLGENFDIGALSSILANNGINPSLSRFNSSCMTVPMQLEFTVQKYLELNEKVTSIIYGRLG